MDPLIIASVLFTERPPKRTKSGSGPDGARWAKWINIVSALAERLPEEQRAPFRRACDAPSEGQEFDGEK